MIQAPPVPMPPHLDPNFLIERITPFVGLVVLFLGLRWAFRSTVGDAIAERIRMRGRRTWGMPDGAEDPRRVAALEEQVSELQAQVAELAERLDFAERLLAERRERKLGAGQ